MIISPEDQAVLNETRRQFFARGARGLGVAALTSMFARAEGASGLPHFQPKVKRLLDIAPLIPEMKEGMEGAVDYGTARSLKANFREFPVLGKTGTCSNNGTRFGWFASYADTPNGRIVTVFFLEGGRPTFGPKAAELTGAFYRALYDRDYFQPKGTQVAESGFSTARAAN